MDLITSILLQKPNNGDEGAWMQLLVIIILFVGYAIQTYFKAKSTLDQEQQKTPSKKTRPRGRKDSGEYKTLSQLREERRSRIQQAESGRQRRQVQKTPQPQPQQQTPRRPTVAPAPKVQPQKYPKPSPADYRQAFIKPVQKRPLTAPKTPKPIEKTPLIKQQFKKEPIIQGEISDVQLFETYEDIRSAIIYTEIMAKPIALR